MRGQLQRLWSQTHGSVAVEFAILAPAFLMMLIGLFTVSIYLQNYNAIRSVVSDSVRKVTVSYQNENALNEDEIHSLILGSAVAAPYLLKSDYLDIQVERQATSRVNGTIEFDVRVNYDEPDFLPFVDLSSLIISYNRPVFVVPTTPST